MSKAKKDRNIKTDRRWAEGAIVYQVYPRSFYDASGDGIGDIRGVTEKLAYLVELGVNAIWLSPFYPSPMADFGYDVADYCDIDPIFGTLKDMDELIEKAHKKDIKIIVDLVPNHTSDEHEWFRQSKQSHEDPYSDWYIWKDPSGHDADGKPLPPNNWLSIMTGGPAWEWEASRQQFYLHTFDVRQPDLNWANKAVREAIKDAMRFWLDRGVDGFRVDAVPYMAKDPLYRDEPSNPHHSGGPGAHYNSLLHPYNHGWPPMYAYLSEMAAVLKESKYAQADRFMVTEAYPETHNSVEEYLEFYEGMDAEVAAPFIFEGMCIPWQAEPWQKFLTTFHKTIAEFSPHCVASYAFGNHDQPRLVTRFGEPAARSSAVMLLTLPGMAFIYNGDEIGMKNGTIPPEMVQDPAALDGSGRDPERTPLQWSGAPNAGFTTAKSSWLPVADDYRTHNVETESANPDSFLSLYRKLGKLRNQSDALRYGGIEVLDSGHDDVLAFRRFSSDSAESYITLVNFSKAKVQIKPGLLPDTAKLIVSSHSGHALSKRKMKTFELLPCEGALLKL
jgi:alpha-glucosidase